jgi:hypothetical protein
MIDLHLSAFAPRWRFLYAVRIDAYFYFIHFLSYVLKVKGLYHREQHCSLR